jgi:hypothetical protein
VSNSTAASPHRSDSAISPLGQASGLVEPLRGDLVFVFPVAPGDVRRGSQVGFDQRFLRASPHGQTLVGRQGLGQADRARVSIEGLSVVAVGSVGQQVAAQTPGASLQVQGPRGSFDHGLRVVQRGGEQPGLGQQRGPRQ